MATDLYCSRADLYKYGFRPGTLANPARAIAAVSASSELLTLDGHGFADDDELTFRVEDGGEMPAPLVAGTTYYAIAVSDSTFKVAATAGGSAINITSAGSDVLVSSSLGPTIDAVIEKYSRLWDAHAIADTVPYEQDAIPTLARSSVAEASASAMLEIQGQASEIQQRKLERVGELFAKLAKGVPTRDAVASGGGNLAVVAVATAGDPRGWHNGDSTRIP